MASCIFSTKSCVREVKLGSLKTATALQPCSMTAVWHELMRMHLVRRQSKAKTKVVKVASVSGVNRYSPPFKNRSRTFELLLVPHYLRRRRIKE